MFLRFIIFFLISVFITPHSLAQSEEERRKGFYEHQKENKKFEQEREAGLKDYLKEQAEWEEQRKKDTLADKKNKKQETPAENSAEYRADRKGKYEDYEEYEKARKAYVKEKKSHEAKNAKEQAKREEWALEEYNLDKERPRFDIAKRNLLGGKSGGSPGGGSSGGIGGGAPNFPAPPAFDDFSDGYVPPPFPPPESFEPSPESFPPPPPIPFPGEAGPGGDFDGGYYPPPPPPPSMPMPPGGGF
ncbi:MAG TPA: hypothetical protein VIG33_15630 [Pseudobdellovibrionaceae bacterium]